MLKHYLEDSGIKTDKFEEALVKAFIKKMKVTEDNYTKEGMTTLNKYVDPISDKEEWTDYEKKEAKYKIETAKKIKTGYKEITTMKAHVNDKAAKHVIDGLAKDGSIKKSMTPFHFGKGGGKITQSWIDATKSSGGSGSPSKTPKTDIIFGNAQVSLKVGPARLVSGGAPEINAITHLVLENSTFKSKIESELKKSELVDKKLASALKTVTALGKSKSPVFKKMQHKRVHQGTAWLGNVIKLLDKELVVGDDKKTDAALKKALVYIANKQKLFEKSQAQINVGKIFDKLAKATDWKTIDDEEKKKRILTAIQKSGHLIDSDKADDSVTSKTDAKKVVRVASSLGLTTKQLNKLANDKTFRDDLRFVSEQLDNHKNMAAKFNSVFENSPAFKKAVIGEAMTGKFKFATGDRAVADTVLAIQKKSVNPEYQWHKIDAEYITKMTGKVSASIGFKSGESIKNKDEEWNKSRDTFSALHLAIEDLFNESEIFDKALSRVYNEAKVNDITGNYYSEALLTDTLDKLKIMAQNFKAKLTSFIEKIEEFFVEVWGKFKEGVGALFEFLGIEIETNGMEDEQILFL